MNILNKITDDVFFASLGLLSMLLLMPMIGYADNECKVEYSEKPELLNRSVINLDSGESIFMDIDDLAYVKNIGRNNIEVTINDSNRIIEVDDSYPLFAIHVLPTSLTYINCLDSSQSLPALDTFWGKAENCDSGSLGNRDDQTVPYKDKSLLTRGARGNKDKFQNFVITPEFKLINQYLMMQASSKTYYTNFSHGLNNDGDDWDYARNEYEYRCGATELYKYWGFNDVYFANPPYLEELSNLTGVNAIIAVDDDKIIIAIRGTQGGEIDKVGDPELAMKESYKMVLDLATNGEPRLRPAISYGIDTPFLVDLGYARAAKSLVDLLHNSGKLIELSNGFTKPIFVGGHSLGAATASLVGLQLNELGYNVPATYVAAPPDFGSRAFNNYLRNNINLYVTWNYRDPVPALSTDIALASLPDPLSILKLALGAATQFTFYDKSHQAIVYDDIGVNYQTIVADIREKQGKPRPKVSVGNQWHFHNAAFYLAFAYKQLMDDPSFTPKLGTGIAPEFDGVTAKCIYSVNSTKRLFHRNVNYETYLLDDNGTPFSECVDEEPYQLEIQDELLLDIVENNLPTFRVTIAKDGLGKIFQVYDDAPQIDCGNNCEQIFEEGSRISLRAEAATNYEFVKWEGCTEITTPNHDCSLLVKHNMTVRAIFRQTKYSLNIEKRGLGQVIHIAEAGVFSSEPIRADSPIIGGPFFHLDDQKINCGDICEALFDVPKAVLQPQTQGPRVVISPGREQSLGERPLIAPPPVNPLTARKNDPLDLVLEMPEPERVVLRVTAAPQYRFVKWEGCSSFNEEGDCRVTMNRDHNIKAFFEQLVIRIKEPSINVRAPLNSQVIKPKSLLTD